MENLITYLLTIKTKVQIAHWQTSDYSKHLILGELYKDLDKSLDKIVELFNRNGDFSFTQRSSIFLTNIHHNEIIRELCTFTQELSRVNSDRRDIQNSIEELEGILNRSIYLLRMN
jgi:DNA-binding ferritin-like protein